MILKQLELNQVNDSAPLIVYLVLGALILPARAVIIFVVVISVIIAARTVVAVIAVIVSVVIVVAVTAVFIFVLANCLDHIDHDDDYKHEHYYNRNNIREGKMQTKRTLE